MLYLISALAGLIIGSFSNVCIARMPADESILFPRSRCPRCGKSIRIRDNIPIVSFVLLGGRCAHCRGRISIQYPLVEASMSALFLLSAWHYQQNLTQVVVLDILIFYFLTISVIDFHHKIIPDELSLSLFGIGLLISYFNPFIQGIPWARPVESLLAGLVGGGFMLLFAWVGEKLFKKEALGGGDIKLMAGFGTTLGWTGLIGSMTLGSFIGAACGLALMGLKRKRAGDTIPYGPFLCLGGFLTALFPTWWHSFIFP